METVHAFTWYFLSPICGVGIGIIPTFKVGNLRLREVKSVAELGCEHSWCTSRSPTQAVLPLLTVGREAGPWRCSWRACPDSQRTQQAADHCERGARFLGMTSGLRLLAALSRSPPVLLSPDGAQCRGQHGIARGWDAAPSPREPNWAARSWRDTFPPLHQDTHACTHLRHDVRPASFCPLCLPHGSAPRSGKS